DSEVPHSRAGRYTDTVQRDSVLRPPGGGSNISFGNEEEKPVRVNKMASSVFAEPEDPYANRRNNPPGTTCR
uniref:Jupiter microtubule associated homolog 1a n=1 Tax=Periophthalmus magnuspinnatus TaxID=409849 RepID=A0A3B4BAT8_9GOBI